MFFPPKRHFLFIVQCLPLFPLSLFWPPPFSLSLSLLFVFLPSCLSCLLSFASLFLSLCFLFFLLCFCFMRRTTPKYSISKFFFPCILSLFFGFLSCSLFQIPFSYLCFFLILSYVFGSTSMFLVSKQTRKNQFLVKRGVATKRCLL